MSRTVVSEDALSALWECLWTYLVYPKRQTLKRERENILPSELVPASQERQGGTSSPWLKPGASVPLGMVNTAANINVDKLATCLYND